MHKLTCSHSNVHLVCMQPRAAVQLDLLLIQAAICRSWSL